MGRRLKIMLLLMLALLIWFPVFLLIMYSFGGTQEIIDCFGGVLLGNGNPVQFRLIPAYPTLRGYVELLFDSSGFFVMFWNSCIQVFSILAGQLLVSVPAAWAFAHFIFPGKRCCFICICYC